MPHSFDAPVRGVPEYCCNLRFVTEKLEWCGYTMFKDMITRFDTIHERDRQRDRQTDRTLHGGIGALAA